MTEEEQPPEEFVTHELAFLGEQDGEPERKLKDALISVLGTYPIAKRAYLARVTYGDPDAFEVALCIACDQAPPEVLLHELADAFKDLFSAEEHLDILVLSEQRERELQQVCAPFHRG